MAASTFAPELLARDRLADPLCRRVVSAMVRRRVPSADADDVAQTVLCDALAAPKLPSEESELRRFLCVLARNKIVDFHRRSKRAATTELDEDGGLPSAATVMPVMEVSPVEARALLERVVRDASPRDRETLEWLVREHEGEELGEIADSVGLPAPTVRQRVSRLRRALRAQWASALAVLVLLGACGAGVKHYASDPAREAITADPSGDPGVRVLGLAQGRWRIDDASAIEDRSFDPRLVELRVTGRTIEIVSPFDVAARTVTRSFAIDADTFAIEMTDASGKREQAKLVVADGAIVVTLREGRLRGTAKLVRK